MIEMSLTMMCISVVATLLGGYILGYTIAARRADKFHFKMMDVHIAESDVLLKALSEENK